MNRQKKSLWPIFFVFLFCLSANVNAQNSNAPKATSKNYLIKEVFIIAEAGATPLLGNIVVEGGLITGIGRNVSAPFDAQIIEGDSMYAYPGFIDLLSHIAIESGDSDEDVKITDPYNPPNDYVGITPERSATPYYDHNSSDIKSLRKNGYTVLQVVPKGRMLPGQSSIVLLGGGSKDAVILKDKANVFAQFKGSKNRSFPATTIGVMAKWRELYTQASYAQKHIKDYNKNPSGLTRPSYSNAIVAMGAVTDKTKKVFFNTPKARDIHRAVQLQKELGFNLVLSNVKQAFLSVDQIKASKAELVLSVSLPDTIATEKKDKEKKIDLEQQALMDKRKASIKEYEQQAMLLEKNAIPFAFSLLDAKSGDLHPSLLRMIDQGLSQKTALAALTSVPAQMLDIDDQVGSLTKGKIANIVMTKRPYFDKKAKIKYVWVDGLPYKMEAKKKSKKSDKDSAISGIYNYETDLPISDNTGTLTIIKDGDQYKLEIVSDEDPTDQIKVDGVDLSDGNMSFDFEIIEDGNTMNVSMDLNFKDNDFEGDLIVQNFGTFKIEGSKKETPEQKNK